MTDLNVRLSVQIPAGATIQSNRTVTVGAHRKIDFSLPPGNGTQAGMEIKFLPDQSDAGKINLLLIQSSFYTNVGLTHLPPKSPKSGGLRSVPPQIWGARGAEIAELRKS